MQKALRGSLGLWRWKSQPPWLWCLSHHIPQPQPPTRGVSGSASWAQSLPASCTPPGRLQHHEATMTPSYVLLKMESARYWNFMLHDGTVDTEYTVSMKWLAWVNLHSCINPSGNRQIIKYPPAVTPNLHMKAFIFADFSMGKKSHDAWNRRRIKPDLKIYKSLGVHTLPNTKSQRAPPAAKIQKMKNHSSVFHCFLSTYSHNFTFS